MIPFDLGVTLPWVLMAVGCGIGFMLERQGKRLVERLDVLEEEMEALQDDLLAVKFATMVSLPAGAEAPAFELPDLHGRRVSLEQFRGQRVLLIFVSPTCPICQEMAPELARLPVDGEDGRPHPVLVTIGDLEANRAQVAEHGIRCPVLLDEAKTVTALYQPEGTPAAYLIDEVGLIAKERSDGAQAVLNLAVPLTLAPAEPYHHGAEHGAEPASEPAPAAVASTVAGEPGHGQAGAQHEVRVPIRGIPQEGIGVGDLLKRVTDAMGIKACYGCERRRQKLNRWVIRNSRSVIKGSGPTARGEGR